MLADLRTRRSSAAVLVFGLTLTAIFIVALLIATSLGTYDAWGGFFIGPILIALSLPVLMRQAEREGDHRLLRLLLAALLLKLIGAVVRHYVAFDVYGGVADAARYIRLGEHLAHGFQHGNFHTGL